MKTLRTFLFASVLALTAFATVFYSSCKKDPATTPGSVDTKCIDVNCNNGSCSQGVCACNPGWEGIFCDIKVVDKYVGNWAAIETITYSLDPTTVGDTFSYVFSILPNGSEVLSFKIAGLMGSDDTILAQLGDPVGHGYSARGFYISNQYMLDVNANTPLVYIPAGGGRVSSSGNLMDTMGYNRRYEYFNGVDTVFRKDTVRVITQKI